MRLNLRQIEAFRYVYQTGNMTTAADLMGISQPAISRLVRDLEAEVGFRLFDRTRSGVSATADATEFFREVDRSFLGLDRLAKVAGELRRKRAGDIRIAATVATSFYLLPDIIRQFRSKRDGVRISLHACASPEVRERVSLQQFDFGIAVVPADAPGIKSLDLPVLETVCVLPQHHPLTRKSVIRPADLDGEPLLMISDYSLTHQQIMRNLEAAGISLNIQLESTFSAPICDLIRQGEGLSILEPVTPRAYEKSGLAIRRFEPVVALELKVIYPENRPLSEPALDLIDILRDRLAALQS